MGHYHPASWEICECDSPPLAYAKGDAIPEAVSPEGRTGCNGPTSLVRQQLIDLLFETTPMLRSDAEEVADSLLAEFVVMKRIKGDDDE